MTFTPRIASRTRELLLNRPRTMTLDDIVAKTGLTKGWLNDFSTQSMRDHGVNKVETLYFFLTGEGLCNDDSK